MNAKENIKAIGALTAYTAWKLAPAGLTIEAANLLVQGNVLPAVASAGLASCIYKINSDVERDAEHERVEGDIIRTGTITDRAIRYYYLADRKAKFILPEPGTPLYVSLDRSQRIFDPDELVDELGRNPADIAVRVLITMFHHNKKRRLNLKEIETLRKTAALLKIAPELETSLCGEGQEKVTILNQIVDKYEKLYALEAETRDQATKRRTS